MLKSHKNLNLLNRELCIFKDDNYLKVANLSLMKCHSVPLIQ